MSHNKDVAPTEPGTYRARHYGDWTTVEVRADGNTYANDGHRIMRTDDIYGGIEAWGERVAPERTTSSHEAVRIEQLERDLARALASRMFGEDPFVLDRMGALGYMRALGLPDATEADLDAACEGLHVPWGTEAERKANEAQTS